MSKDSALAFGKLQTDGSVKPGRLIKGKEAYSAYHLNYYLNEIINKREQFKEASSIQIDDILRADRDVILYALIEGYAESENKDFSITELGSSLFELIDGLELLQKKFREQIIIKKVCRFIGIEIDKNYNFLAKQLHSNYDTRFFEDLIEASTNIEKEKMNILYDRAVASYAIEDTCQYIDFIDKYDIALVQGYFSFTGEFEYSGQEGTSYKYFDYKLLKERFKNRMIHLYGKRRPSMIGIDELDKSNVVEGAYLFCKKDIPENVLKVICKNYLAENFLKSKVSSTTSLDFDRIKMVIASNQSC